MAVLVVQPTAHGDVKEYIYAAAGTTNTMPNDGRTVLLVKTGATASGTMTVVSRACSHARLQDVLETLAADKFYVVGPFPAELYNDADGAVPVNFSSATDVTLAAIRP